MALSNTDISVLLFKAQQGVSSTTNVKQFFEEPYSGKQPVYPTVQVWAQYLDIPTTAPGGTDAQVTGVVKRFIAKTLTAVAGVPGAFQHADLVDCIPFNFGDGSYNYALTDSTGASIPFGSGDWIVDPGTGVLTFYGTVPANMPPKLSFYKYVGIKGAGVGRYTTTQRDALTSLTAGMLIYNTTLSSYNFYNGTAWTIIGTQIPSYTTAQRDGLVGMTDGMLIYNTTTKAYNFYNGTTLAWTAVGTGSGGSSGINYIKNANAETDLTGWSTFNTVKNVNTTGPINLTNDDIILNFPSSLPVLYLVTTGSITPLVSGTTYYTLPGVTAGSYNQLSATSTGGAIDLTARTAPDVNFKPLSYVPNLILNAISLGSLTRNLTTPIRGLSDFKYTAGGAGEGFYYAFTIDPADQGKMLSLNFDYKIGGTGYTDNGLKIVIHDVTNNTVIDNFTNGVANANTYASHQTTFQTAINSVSYRVFFFQAVDTNTWNIQFSNVSVGPQIKSIGTLTKDVELWTPTGSWTGTTYQGWKWRVGDRGYYVVVATRSGTATTGLAINMPPGEVMDLNKMPNLGGDFAWLGEGTATDAGAQSYPLLVGYSTTTQVTASTINVAATSAVIAGQTATLPFTFGTGDFILARWNVPIVGWGSNTVSSYDVGARPAIFYGTNIAATVIASGGTGLNAIPFTAQVDTQGAWSGTEYTVKVPGTYRVSSTLYFGSGNSWTISTKNMIIRKNNVDSGYMTLYAPAAAYTGALSLVGTRTIRCNVGDILALRLQHNEAASKTLDNTVDVNQFSIELISQGNQQVVQGEAILARYYTGSGQSYPVNTQSVLNYGTMSFDSHGAVTVGASWRFTAPVAGKYEVTAYSALQPTGNWAIGDEWSITLFKNGVDYGSLGYDIAMGVGSYRLIANGSDIVELKQGEYIDVRGYQFNAGSGAKSISTNLGLNKVSIVRVGNY